MSEAEKLQFASSGVLQFKDKLIRDLYVDIKYYVSKFEHILYRKNKNKRARVEKKKKQFVFKNK